MGSDDESNAATDGSTLRTPAEPAGSSESGGSGVESIGGASGRSSTCDQMHSSPPRTEMIQSGQSTSTANVQEEIREESSEDNNEAELIHKLHVLRYVFRKRFFSTAIKLCNRCKCGFFPLQSVNSPENGR